MSAAVSVILNRAADEMEKRGKARGTMINRQGNVCAYGAIRLAAGGVVGKDGSVNAIFTSRMDWNLYSRAGRALDYYLISQGKYKHTGEGPAQWNDRNNKTTVVTALREAANANA